MTSIANPSDSSSSSSSSSSWRRWAFAIAGAVLAALLLAACGGSSSKNTSTNSAADNALSFSKCMREHGVKDFPNPEVSGGKVSLRFAAKAGSPGGVSPQTMEAAQNACRHFTAASEPKLTPQEKVERQETVLKFAKCMREHGIDVHASTSGGGVQIQVHPRAAGGGPNPESPTFQTAQKACQGLLPFKGPAGGGPGTSSSGGGKGPASGLAFGG